MIFTEERTEYIVVAANAAPYPAYAIIHAGRIFKEDLAIAKEALDYLFEITDWHELTLHKREDIIWLKESIFSDLLTKIAWEEYGNGTYSYAKISEEEIAHFMKDGMNRENIQMCSLNLTSHNTFYFNTEVFNEETGRRETYISRHIEVDDVLQPYQEDDDRFGFP